MGTARAPRAARSMPPVRHARHLGPILRPDAPCSTPPRTSSSPSTFLALRPGVRLACARGRATARASRWSRSLSWPDAGPFEVPGEAPTAAQESAEENELAQRALAELAGATDVTLVVRRSNVPAFEIRDYARAMGAGLVVMGASGRRHRGPLLGSVASEVVQTAPCDVLLVPHREGAPFSSAPPRRVLVPVDFSASSRPLAAFGLGLARDLGAVGVDLVHVLEPLPHPLRWIDEALVDAVPKIRDRARAALQELAEEVRQRVDGARSSRSTSSAARPPARSSAWPTRSATTWS